MRHSSGTKQLPQRKQGPNLARCSQGAFLKGGVRNTARLFRCWWAKQVPSPDSALASLVCARFPLKPVRI